MAFAFLNSWKKKLGEEKYLETQENYINFNFSVHEVLQEHSHTHWFMHALCSI